jgi:hypothetical protein
MQNLKNKIILIAALSLGAAYYFSSQKEENTKEIIAEEEQIKSSPKLTDLIKKRAEKESGNIGGHIHSSSPSGKIAAQKTDYIPVKIETSELAEFTSLSNEEKKSLIVLSAAMAEAVSAEADMDKFVEKLTTLKMKPIIMKDENPYTGVMNVVRTESVLPGIRYVHAQYFTDEDGVKNLGHISFELKPGKDSEAAAHKIIQKQFNIQSKPTSKTKNMTVWNVGDRVVWIKVFDKEDVSKPDPFNAYDPVKDIGTVRIVSEPEIH